MHSVENLDDIKINQNKKLKEALKVLDKSGYQILIVLNNKEQVVGTVTDGDIRRHLLRDQNFNISIGKIANKNFLFLEECQIDQAKKFLIENDVQSLPVLCKDKKLLLVLIDKNYSITTGKKNNMPVVIMAGGKGTRLEPLTKIIPKPLIPVDHTTIIEVIMKKFFDQGFSNFYIIINYKKELIKSYIKELKLPYKIKFIEEKYFLGTVGGLYLLKNKMKSDFILTNCDITADFNYNKMIEWHKKSNNLLTILGVKKTTKISYGILRLNEDNDVIKIDEKPNINYLINGGIYIINKYILTKIKSNNYLDMDQLLETLLKSKKSKVSCYPIESGWNDIGQFKYYKELQDQIL